MMTHTQEDLGVGELECQVHFKTSLDKKAKIKLSEILLKTVWYSK